MAACVCVCVFSGVFEGVRRAARALKRPLGDINAEEGGEIHYWEPLGAVLGLPGGRQGGRTSSTNVQGARSWSVSGPPHPLPKLLAKANSD